jgi:tripartite-type tricarboxylate transporter receptor subunit TctC
LAISIGCLAAPVTCLAQDSFYSGKRISLIVGTSPGGGQDAYGRLLGRHLGRNIPGSPIVVVQNMPGAASMNGVLALDNAAPRDGTTIATFNPGQVLGSIVTPEKVKVKFTEFSWLGSTGQETTVCFMWAGTGVKSWDDMLKKEQVVMGDTGGGGSGSYTLQKMLQQIFNVKLKQVLGYPGSSEKSLAIERGELDGDCTNWASIPADWRRDNKIVPVIRFQEYTPRDLPKSVTYAGSLIQDPDKRKLLDLLNVPASIGHPFILSKAVPPDRVKILRKAFEKTMKDPEFLADAEKAGRDISPISGEEVADMLKMLYATPPDIIKAARSILGN